MCVTECVCGSRADSDSDIAVAYDYYYFSGISSLKITKYSAESPALAKSQSSVDLSKSSKSGD
jgi:hypothetical protein